MSNFQGHFEDSSGNIVLPIPSGGTATVETTNKASQTYTKGTLLYFNNRLCKTTTAIAANATLAVGTNLAYTSLGTEFSSHMVASTGAEFSFQTLINGGYN